MQTTLETELTLLHFAFVQDQQINQAKCNNCLIINQAGDLSVMDLNLICGLSVWLQEELAIELYTLKSLLIRRVKSCFLKLWEILLAYSMCGLQ